MLFPATVVPLHLLRIWGNSTIGLDRYNLGASQDIFFEIRLVVRNQGKKHWPILTTNWQHEMAEKEPGNPVFVGWHPIVVYDVTSKIIS